MEQVTEEALATLVIFAHRVACARAKVDDPKMADSARWKHFEGGAGIFDVARKELGRFLPLNQQRSWRTITVL